ncbi:hypothetical protein P3T43_003540 [Paraburkholderia sp. GAS41]|uniref:caspase family protein n=1 Tax=Paraburkholderia sp. GAS41 TaxID=3035134 RepID=UPI003D1B2185
MGINLAIIAGVTDYPNEIGALPACKNDVDIMQQLIAGTGKFSEIHTIPSDDGKAVKARIADIVARFKNEEIDDLFFYFTGHGEFVDGEFRYLMRDYSRSKPAQTSLSNTELDNFLRSLQPKLTIKVVDACYSGMPYIKDGSNFSDYMKAATEATFSKCYFLFSSQSDQTSWAGENISDFTKAFVNAVANSALDSIRYGDVIDTISDAFQTASQQRPLFVVQADFTEILGNFSETVRMALKERLIGLYVTPTAQQPGAKKMSLAERIRDSAQEYVSMDDAISVIENLKINLSKFKLSADIALFFSTSAESQDSYRSVPSPEALGKWLSKSDGQYFATPIYETETYEVEASDIFSLMSIQNGGQRKMTTKTRRVIAGVNTQLQGLPFVSFFILLDPNSPNLTQYGGWLTYFLSKTTLQAFYCFSVFKEVNWGEYRPGKTSEWESVNCKLSETRDASAISESFLAKLEEFVEKDVIERLGLEQQEMGSSGEAPVLSAPEDA